MSEINQPEGWATRIAAECFVQIPTTGIKIKTRDCQKSGLYPVIDQGQEFISGFIDDSEKLIKLDKPVIVFGDHTRNIKWVDFAFVPGADGIKILSPKGFLLPRAAFYELKNLEIPDKGYSRHFKFLKELEIPIPPLAEQKVIADKLDILLEQVETTKARLERISEILKTFRQSLIAAAVSGRLTKDWRISQLMTITDWKNVSAADVCLRITDGEHQTPKRQNCGRILLSAKNIRDGYIDYQNHDLISQQDFDKCLKRCYAETGDVLIVSVGATIGRAAIKKDEIDFALVRSVGLFKVDANKVIGEYLLYTLQSSAVQKFINEISRGNAQPTLYISAMSTIPVYLPPLKEQTEIVRRVEELFIYADNIEQKAKAALKRVNNLTQSILAKAFRGEFTADWRAANPDLIRGDNSAEALLEKIGAECEAIKKQPKPKRTAIKNKTGSRMSKQIIKVVDALKEAGEPLSGQQLLAAAGYPSDSDTDQLEQFFLDIRKELIGEKSIVKLERADDGQDWFTLAQNAAKE